MADADKSGDLVISEMRKFADAIKQSESLHKLFAMADTDKDGKVTLEEFSNFLTTLLQGSCCTVWYVALTLLLAAATFNKVDKNKNKTIDKDELAEVLAIMAAPGAFCIVSVSWRVRCIVSLSLLTC